MGMDMPNFDRIQKEYDQLWDTSKAALAQGLIEPDSIPCEGGRRWGVSVIVRPTEPVLNRLGAVISEISRLTGPENVIYSVSNLHTTLRTIELYRKNVPVGDKLIQCYVDIMQDIAYRFRTICISYCGLTANKTSIMAQGWPRDNTFQAIRDEFHKQLDRSGLLIGPESDSVRQTAHASLVVFNTPILSPDSCVEYIEANRKIDYGSAEITEIEIIRYEKSDTSVRILVLGKIKLGSR